MSVGGLDASCVRTIKEYYWNDTDAEMREIVEGSISGEQGDIVQVTTFDPKPIRAIVGGIVLLSTTFGYPGLFKGSVEKICSVVIKTQRLQIGRGGSKSSWTSVAILSLLLPSPGTRRANLPYYENLLNDALPRMHEIPREEVPCYQIICAENDKRTEIETVSTVDLATVIGAVKVVKPKKGEAEESSQNSQGSQFSFLQSHPMDAD